MVFKKILVVLALCISPAAFADTEFAKGVEMMRESEQQDAFVQKFAEAAKAKDGAAVIAMVDPSLMPPDSEEALIGWLSKETFPFFENFQKMHTYKKITNAVLPDGRQGLWHYTYIIDSEEKVRPFRMAIINTEDGPKLIDVVVNQCVKDRHPFCP